MSQSEIIEIIERNRDNGKWFHLEDFCNILNKSKAAIRMNLKKLRKENIMQAKRYGTNSFVYKAKDI